VESKYSLNPMITGLASIAGEDNIIKITVISIVCAIIISPIVYVGNT
jgi:hypothetical protein